MIEVRSHDETRNDLGLHPRRGDVEKVVDPRSCHGVGVEVGEDASLPRCEMERGGGEVEIEPAEPAQPSHGTAPARPAFVRTPARWSGGPSTSRHSRTFCPPGFGNPTLSNPRPK